MRHWARNNAYHRQHKHVAESVDRQKRSTNRLRFLYTSLFITRIENDNETNKQAEEKERNLTKLYTKYVTPVQYQIL